VATADIFGSITYSSVIVVDAGTQDGGVGKEICGTALDSDRQVFDTGPDLDPQALHFLW
jgi:hypothetical protein